MITKTPVIRILFVSLMGIITFSGQHISAADSIQLYTTNTKISVPPGESVDYSIDVINNSQKTEICNISIEGVPRSWNYILKNF